MGLLHPTDRRIKHGRSHIIVYNDKIGECLIKNAAIHTHKNITVNEIKKITKYAKLKIEISRI